MACSTFISLAVLIKLLEIQHISVIDCNAATSKAKEKKIFKTVAGTITLFDPTNAQPVLQLINEIQHNRKKHSTLHTYS